MHLNTVREEIDENEWKSIEAEIHHAIEDLNNYRLNEGKVLEQLTLITALLP